MLRVSAWFNGQGFSVSVPAPTECNHKPMAFNKESSISSVWDEIQFIRVSYPRAALEDGIVILVVRLFLGPDED